MEETERGNMQKLTRYEVLGKCVTLFEALKRMASQGNVGLVPLQGAENSFWIDAQILDTLKEMMRETQTAEKRTNTPEPDVPKVVELTEWQRLAAKGPPERLDFDEK